MRGVAVVVSCVLGCGRIAFEERVVTGDSGSVVDAAQPARILFVRAGAGTVGFLNGDSDDNACDVFDRFNERGWAMLNEALVAAGFEIDQRIEGPLSAPAPVDLARLDDYAIVVFGSNNFPYGSQDADLVEDYVRTGGAALFVSDAAFGRTSYAEAPASDQPFMGRFDLEMLQDANDVITLDSSRFTDPTHPVLAGVTSLEADGTSAIRIQNVVSDVTPLMLVRKMPGQVRIGGATQAAGANDAAVVIADVGAGRAAGLLDRDVLANGNPNSGIGMASNRTLAINLFEWLARRR